MTQKMAQSGTASAMSPRRLAPSGSRPNQAYCSPCVIRPIGIAAISAELEAESGHKVMALSGASGAGVGAVLDKLLEAIGHPEPGEDESEDAGSDWSPI